MVMLEDSEFMGQLESIDVSNQELILLISCGWVSGIWLIMDFFFNNSIQCQL